MPRLSNVRIQWWRKKWNTVNGILYRGNITTVSFGYNPLTEIVTAGMEYDTEFFCDHEKVWRPV